VGPPEGLDHSPSAPHRAGTVDRQFVLRLVHRRQSGGQGRHLAGRVAGFLQPRRLEIASYRAFDVACPDVFIMLYWGHRSPWWLIEDQENLSGFLPSNIHSTQADVPPSTKNPLGWTASLLPRKLPTRKPSKSGRPTQSRTNEHGAIFATRPAAKVGRIPRSVRGGRGDRAGKLNHYALDQAWQGEGAAMDSPLWPLD
jgi:hypothetical protein